jgi:hypothetical protein
MRPLPTTSSGLWENTPSRSRLVALNSKAKWQQWNESDLDWTIPSAFGSPLPEDSPFALAAFHNSSLSRYGRAFWDVFRWEFQSWMITQFLSGEHAAHLSAKRLLEKIPNEDAKACLTSQVADEARHVTVFTRYMDEKIPAPYPLSSSFVTILRDALNDSRWDFAVLGMQIVVEGVALAAFRLGSKTFHDDLIKRICRLAAKDEARHVSFGLFSLDGFYRTLTQSELKQREDFVLEALDLLGRSFMLSEIWERLGINKADGSSFMKSSSLTQEYRRAISMKVQSCLDRLGLMTPGIRSRLDLLSPNTSADF